VEARHGLGYAEGLRQAARSIRDLRRVLSAGVLALVDLAANEPPTAVTHELVYCRFPLVDGPGNPPWLLRGVAETTAWLLRSDVPTLVYCGSGMSRSPAIAAAAISLAGGGPPDTCLAALAKSGPHDISPALWHEMTASLT
jgi:hypothetical protein